MVLEEGLGVREVREMRNGWTDESIADFLTNEYEFYQWVIPYFKRSGVVPHNLPSHCLTGNGWITDFVCHCRTIRELSVSETGRIPTTHWKIIIDLVYHYYHDELFGCDYNEEEEDKKPEEILQEINEHLESAAEHFAKVANNLKPEEEYDMANLIETKTFIRGEDAINLTDNQIFDAIADIEKEIKKLREVGTASKKLDARIAELEASCKALAEYVDGR